MFSSTALNNQINIEKKVRYALYALLILASTSSFMAPSPRQAVIEVSIFAALCYLALFFANLYYNYKERFIKYLMLGLWVSIGLYLFAFTVGYTTACIFRKPLTWPAPLLGFNNVRSFNQYQLWGLGIAYLPLLNNGFEKSKKILLSFGLTLWWVLLFYSASRGVLVALLIGAFFTVLIYQKFSYSFLRLQFIQAICGYCVYYTLFKIVPKLLNMELVSGQIFRGTTSDRTGLWKLAVAITEKHPWLGAGPMHYPWFGPSNYHPHNSVLQLASEWGLPATLIMLCLAFYGMLHWVHHFRPNNLSSKPTEENHFSLLLFFTVVTNAAYSLVDGVIVMPMSQTMMFTVIGIVIGQYASKRTAIAQNNSSDKNIRFRPLFSALVLIGLVWSNSPEVNQAFINYEKGFSVSADRVTPRIWIQMSPPPKTIQEIEN